MPTIEMIEVPLRRTGLSVVCSAFLVFVAAGLLLAIYAERISTRAPAVIRLVGLSLTAFFGLGVLQTARRLLQNRPGLRFDSQGFDDSSSFASAGRVEWREVSRLRVRSLDVDRFLSVELHDPSRLLQSGPVWVRWLRVANFKIFGSPVQISSSSFNMEFDELVQTFEHYLQQSTDAP